MLPHTNNETLRECLFLMIWAPSISFCDATVVMQCPRRFLGIIDQNPSVSVVRILVQPVTCCDLPIFLSQSKIYSIDSPRMIDSLPVILNLNWVCSGRFSPIIVVLICHLNC